MLDPEQNNTFSDHYLDVAFDLSKVLFIATANQLDPIPGPLRDRMEIIELPGYTFEEKQQIARIHLVPKQLEEHGLSADAHRHRGRRAAHHHHQLHPRGGRAQPGAAHRRRLPRGGGARSPAGKTDKQVITPDRVKDILGPEHFYSEVAERTEVPGVATGLAWTAVGGDLLFIEATKMAGKGGMTLTGQLGDVMKESAQAALSYLRSKADQLGIDRELPGEDGHPHPLPGRRASPRTGPRRASPSSPRSPRS